MSLVRYIPKGCRLQIGSYEFMFNIITSSKNFQCLLLFCIKKDLVRDLGDESLSFLNDEELKKLQPIRYIYIIQKSPTWFTLRSLAQGSASTVGKFIKGPKQYPLASQIEHYWEDKLNNVPFNKTHTMTGHMNWGVGYEDPALLHFAKEENVCVSQVGTIRVNLSFIIKLAKIVHGTSLPDLNYLYTKGQHLLVSPDGLVSEPEKKPLEDQSTVYQTVPKKLLGMLEIKCISPFHHVESNDSFLQWVDDMETRQWFIPNEIPFVYIIQMTMQAISGVNYFKMNSSHTMWFIRWSPRGVSIFKLPFKYLIRLGTVAALFYFSLIQRITKTAQIPGMFNKLTKQEQRLSSLVNEMYKSLMNKTTHKYVKIDDYPEFDIYQKCTEHFKFKVPDIDPDILQTPMPKKDTAKTNAKIDSKVKVKVSDHSQEVDASDLLNCQL